MLKLRITTEDGVALILGGTGNPYQLVDVDGLEPTAVNIATSQVAGFDGELYQASRASARLLNLAVVLEGSDVEQLRATLYQALPVHKLVTINYDGARDVFARGYVQQVDVQYTELPQTVSIAILCPSPWWAAAQEVVNQWSTTRASFTFPFSSAASPKDLVMGLIESQALAQVVNGGEVECGLVFRLYARGNVTNPSILNYKTREYITLNLSLRAGDEVTVDTRDGAKTAILLRGGVESSVFNSVQHGSTWLQLDRLGAIFELVADDGLDNLRGTIHHRDMFAGV